MTLYTDTAYATSRIVTEKYSTSFSMSIRLFAPDIRPHIYAIYGLVRIADEVVDTYRGDDTAQVLRELEVDVYRSLKTGYSANPIVHAFVQTARKYHIGKPLLSPFFTSMRMDLTPQTFTQKKYETYIDGSAEVIGLMCLRVFVDDSAQYNKLEPAARHLGAAYQKVNFLRDIAADHAIGRWYFPTGSFETFNESQKRLIIADINKDFKKAESAVAQLPANCRKAVSLSRQYYGMLVNKISLTPAAELKKRRVSVSPLLKISLLTTTQWGKR